MQSEIVQKLYDQYGCLVFRYIMSRVHHYADAEDLRSEVFVKVMANIGKYDCAKATYSTWIYAITRNVVNDYYRNRQLASIDLNDIPVESMASAAWDQDLSALADALQMCSERERDVMILRHYHGYPYAQIAEKLHLSSANVRMISFRTSKKLRELLKTM
jgi:RNA polymerase sigma-70 factor (ECF subfamily)